MVKLLVDHNGLTAKHGLFCHEFIKDYNATAAYKRAKIGKSKKPAAAACQLMSNPKIVEYIRTLHEKQIAKAEITAQRLTDELAKLAFSNIKDYIQADNELVDIKDLQDKHSAAIESVKITRTVDKFKNETVNVAFKLHNKIAAIETLAKHIGYFEKDNKQKPVLPSGPFKVEIVPPPKE